jgi:hypothetical protein
MSSKLFFSTVARLAETCFIREIDTPVGGRLLRARRVAACLCKKYALEYRSDLDSELGFVIHFIRYHTQSSRSSLLGSSNSFILFQVSIVGSHGGFDRIVSFNALCVVSI